MMKEKVIKQMRRGIVEGGRGESEFDYFPLSNVGCSIEEAINMKYIEL